MPLADTNPRPHPSEGCALLLSYKGLNWCPDPESNRDLPLFRRTLSPRMSYRDSGVAQRGRTALSGTTTRCLAARPAPPSEKPQHAPVLWFRLAGKAGLEPASRTLTECCSRLSELLPHLIWRRVWDSNPRGVSAFRASRAAPSSARPTRHVLVLLAGFQPASPAS